MRSHGSDVLSRLLRWPLAIGVAAFLLFAGPADMLVEGPFAWHVMRPAAWQGALELAALYGFVAYAAYRLRGAKRLIVVVLLTALYARRHGFDLDLLIALAYLESIVALGAAALARTARLEQDGPVFVMMAAALGLLLLSAALWISSAIGWGSLDELRWVTLGLLGIAMLARRRLTTLGYLARLVRDRSWLDSLMAAFVIVATSMLFAKARVSLDFDSLWYGLRGDRVLVGAGSVFDSMGLVAQVHYYPKAYEVLLLPLTGLGSLTAMTGFTIGMWGLVGIAVHALAARIGARAGWARWHVAAVVALVLSTPACMNIAITAKGDLAAAFFTLLGMYGMLAFSEDRSPSRLAVAASAWLAAPMFRISALPFVLALLVGSLLAIVAVRRGAKGTPAPRAEARWPAAVFLLSAVTLSTLCEARTLLLSGMPVIAPTALVHIERSLGFVLAFPVGLAPTWAHVQTVGLPTLLWDFLVRPSRLPHVMIFWTGSAWAAWILAGMLLPAVRRRWSWRYWVLLPPVVAFVAVMGIKRFGLAGGDGNYYLVPVACLILLAMVASAHAFEDTSWRGRAMRILLAGFVTVGMAVSLVTGLWGPGTRRLDADFTRTPWDAAPRAERGLERHGLADVATYLSRLPVDTRAVGLIPDPSGTWLPVRYESLNIISMVNPAVTANASALERFLQRDRIQYLVLPRQVKGARARRLGSEARALLHGLRDRGRARVVVSSGRVELWQLDPARVPGDGAK